MIKQKKKENFIGFAKSLNKFSDIKYVWNKLGVMKDRDNKREWQGKDLNDRIGIVAKEIDKVSPPWVEIKR